MSGDVHVRFWESAGVRFPRATHLPLHRQEAILARSGWDVRRSTLCDHLGKCGQLLTPLYDLTRQRLLRSFAIHADDTPLVLLRPRRAAYAWVYLGDDANPYTLFDLTAGRRQQFPQRFLAGYRGFVHADAYDGYNAVHGHVRHLGCWMHARRYFVDAEPSDPRAVEALAFIRTLYAVEREIQDEREKAGGTFTDAEVVRVRRTRAGPILAAFADWLDIHRRFATPKSLFGQAIGYARNQWSTLIRYLDDARFALDNGVAERAIRPLAIGRGYAQSRAMRSWILERLCFGRRVRLQLRIFRHSRSRKSRSDSVRRGRPAFTSGSSALSVMCGD